MPSNASPSAKMVPAATKTNNAVLLVFWRTAKERKPKNMTDYYDKKFRTELAAEADRALKQLQAETARLSSDNVNKLEHNLAEAIATIKSQKEVMDKAIPLIRELAGWLNPPDISLHLVNDAKKIISLIENKPQQQQEVIIKKRLPKGSKTERTQR